ncbi:MULTISPECIES: thiosulfate oxidation carrier protein SoxY [Stappiaceae]|uniref:Sulfur-oxidizing protein SoxY n=1 Tax=Roseibium marinum TaxID=281252 RepID=A0A2S3V122_9HYPH|nr:MULTISPECIES: thiosulfate oxidation carrier protein SoxY [Stappiaceae]KZM48729.1 sulfur oxidation protein SoxY [Labrenzia sp. OB1]POF33664.1 sulfur-oxidizing protein SoxY [Roseibium marinum]
MTFTRRQVFGLTAGAAAFVAVAPRISFAATDDTEAAIKAFTGGAEPATGTVTLDTPEIAENGNTVPVGVSVESPMTADNYVESVLILAEGNPSPAVATFHFTAMSGAAEAKTRIRLAKTQNVIAVAKMNDGSTFIDRKEVKVTIGGCGG